MSKRRLIRKAVLKQKGYHLDRPVTAIKLNQNESPRDLPPELKSKVLERLAKAEWRRYPSPFCDSLRQKIAQRENWDMEGVLVTGGSNILIQAILLASSVRGKILTIAPTFSLYEMEGDLLENRVIAMPLGKDFALPTQNILMQIRKAKPQVIFLPNPNAPTANLFPEADLVKICESAAKSSCLVVIDEAYYPFSGFTMTPHLKRFENLILLRTLSKAFSLGGVRLGYLLAHPSIAREIQKVLLPFSVGILSQIVGEVILENDGYVAQVVADVVSEREKLFAALQRLPDLSVYPSQANYILFQSPKAASLYESLTRQGVLVRNVSGKRLPNALRVTVGTPEENRKFLEAITAVVF